MSVLEPNFVANALLVSVKIGAFVWLGLHVGWAPAVLVSIIYYAKVIE
jgi:UPF0716 family protein affecting phage T7 exclusion